MGREGGVPGVALVQKAGFFRGTLSGGTLTLPHLWGSRVADAPPIKRETLQLGEAPGGAGVELVHL